MLEPGSVLARAQAFAASTRHLRPVVLLTVGDHRGVTGHVLTAADPRVYQAVQNLAQAIAARAEAAQTVPDLTRTRVVATLVVNRRAAVGGSGATRRRPGGDRATGGDGAADVRRGPGDPPTWVAAVVRRARNGERRRVLAWQATRSGPGNPAHHAGDPDSVVISLLAGGSGRGEVRQRLAQVAAALPGLDVAVRFRIVSPWPSAPAAAGTMLLLAGAALSTTFWRAGPAPDCAAAGAGGCSRRAWR